MEELEDFKKQKNNNILRSMIDYMNFGEEGNNFDCGYSQEDINNCGQILDNYIDELKKCNKEEKLVLESVKKVILELNKLNQECGGTLIETDQREYLCPFIEDAAVIAGLSKAEEDITLKWREW